MNIFKPSQKKQQMADKMKGIESEADKIFMKNRPDMALKDKSYPKVGSAFASPEYNKEYDRTYQQVKKMRLGQNKKYEK